MFEIYQLRYFLAVVETGSFTGAAKRVRVSQPSLSAGIQKLEDAVGVRLFDRSSRRVSLTEAGNRFHDRARTILVQIQAAEAELTGAPQPELLRLGVLVTIPAAKVGDLVRAFRAAHPTALVSLFEGTEQELNNRLDFDQLDLAITIQRPELRSRTQPLYEEGYSLALPSSHPLARKSEITVEQLADEPTIVRRRCEVLSETSRFFTSHNVRPRLVYRTDHDERALAMVSGNLGFTVMPDQYEASGVRRVPLAGFGPRRTVVLLRPRAGGRAPSAPARAFAELAARHAW